MSTSKLCYAFILAEYVAMFTSRVKEQHRISCGIFVGHSEAAETTPFLRPGFFRVYYICPQRDKRLKWLKSCYYSNRSRNFFHSRFCNYSFFLGRLDGISEYGCGRSIPTGGSTYATMNDAATTQPKISACLVSYIYMMIGRTNNNALDTLIAIDFGSVPAVACTRRRL